MRVIGAILAQTEEDPIAPLLEWAARALGIVQGRSSRDAGQAGGLGQAQAADRLGKISLRGRANAHDVRAKLDAIDVGLEDLRFAEVPLDTASHHHLSPLTK